jgi:hypothetical protein
LLYDFYLEKHLQALLVVVERLMQINSYHIHRTQVSVFTELFNDLVVNFIAALELNLLDHREHILFVLLDQVFVKHLGFVLRFDILQSFGFYVEIRTVDCFGEVLKVFDARVFVATDQRLDVNVHFQQFAVELELLDDSLAVELFFNLEMVTF